MQYNPIAKSIAYVLLITYCCYLFTVKGCGSLSEVKYIHFFMNIKFAYNQFRFEKHDMLINNIFI